MKRKKKIIVNVLTLFFLLLVFVGCNFVSHVFAGESESVKKEKIKRGYKGIVVGEPKIASYKGLNTLVFVLVCGGREVIFWAVSGTIEGPGGILGLAVKLSAAKRNNATILVRSGKSLKGFYRMDFVEFPDKIKYYLIKTAKEKRK